MYKYTLLNDKNQFKSHFVPNNKLMLNLLLCTKFVTLP